MAVITPPKYAKKILMTLETAGFEAYLVGGCVRDMLMGKRPRDWDICTNALPDRVLALFPGSQPTGLKHGTVTVHMDKGRVEVTTFRSDGKYTDRRRPESVSFISDLNEDLKRRDFTMNAIALPLSGIVIDPFGGREDIKNRVIRCVGSPPRRFEEDALRMFRALRFSACLGFAVEEATLAAIWQLSPLASSLAAERVRDELERILKSPSPHVLGAVIASGLLNGFLTARGSVTPELRRIGGLPKNKQQRWAAFCAILERAGMISSAEVFLRQLRLSGAEIRNCSDGVSAALNGPPADTLGWKRLLAYKGVQTAMCAAAAAEALYSSGSLRALRAILKSGECFSLRRLAVSGDDLLMLGLSGEELGETLRRLLEHVLVHPADNSRELLLELAMAMRL